MTAIARFSAGWPAISALLDEALALPPAEHAAWLAGLDGERAAHREALRTLLDHQPRVETDDFLGRLPELEIAPPGRSGRLAAGSQVGPWRLVAEIGRGGMGSVWLAERADGLMKRRVALKVPHAVWDEAFVERFAREREILATLEHEHIARLYDAGVDGRGRPFLAMEFVEGEPIDAWCRSRALSLADRVDLLLQVMAAVAYAHARLVVHRDLKPGNILVNPDGQARLLDFGIAQLLVGDRTLSTALTELGGRVLTLDYASPEQIRGAPLGTASDVYSMAVVAYELLAGARPYRLRRGSAAELEEAILAIEPPPASARAVDAGGTPDARLARRLRGDLDAILQRALKKSPGARYATMEGFAQDLRRWRAGLPVEARPDSVGYRTARFMRRHRWAVAMGGALAASVLAGSGVSVWQAQVARRAAAAAIADAERQAAVRDLYVNTLTRLRTLIAEAPGAPVAPATITAALRQTCDELAPRMASSPAGREAQLEAVMLQLNYASDFEGSREVGDRYLALLKSDGAPAARVIDAFGAQGRTLYQLQRYDASEAMRRAGVDWDPAADDRRTELSRLSALNDLGGLLAFRGKRHEAEAVLARGQALATRLFPDEHLRYENLAQLSLYHLGFDDARALDYARQAHAGDRDATGADADERATTLLRYGNALLANGRAAEAEAPLAESRALFLREYGRGSRPAVWAIGRLVGAVARRGDHDRAAALLAEEEKALASIPDVTPAFVARQLGWRGTEIRWLRGAIGTGDAPPLAPAELEALLAPDAIRSAELFLIAQARAWTLAGRGPEAVALMDGMRRRWPDPDRPTVPWSRIVEHLATAQLAAGDPAAARQTVGGFLDILERERSLAGRPGRIAAEIEALADVRLGDTTAAALALARADAAAPSLPFASPVERAEASLRRAEVLHRLGRRDEARATIRAALLDLEGQDPGSPRLAQARDLARAVGL